MGLMDFLPFFRITVDGIDISSTLASRLVNLSLTDAAGVKSDQVQFTLSDTALFSKLAEPSAGAEIKVWLGYAFQLKYMGMFVADTVEVQGPPDQMTVTGYAWLYNQQFPQSALGSIPIALNLLQNTRDLCSPFRAVFIKTF